MQAWEFNNVLTTVQVAIYSTATIFYFCTVFALYFFEDCIACTATAQKGVWNFAGISVNCSLPISWRWWLHGLQLIWLIEMHGWYIYCIVWRFLWFHGEWSFLMDFSKTLHDGMFWTILKMTCSCFWSLISIGSFQDDLLQELSVFMHGCMLSLKNQQWYRASYVTISYTSILTYLPCCGVKRVAVTFVEVSLVLGFLLLADANNADRTLRKYL